MTTALVADLLPGLRAFAIPMTTRFRGITVREGALIEGPAGWGEFSPFAEYGPAECARWLACALEAAVTGWPAPARTQVPVNVTVPAVGPERAHALVTASGCRTAKVKVAERGQPPGADVARVEAVRDALGPAGRIRVDANGAWSVDQAERALRELGRFGLESPSSRAPRWANWRGCGGGWTCRWPPTNRSGGPRIRWRCGRPVPPTSSCSRPSHWAGCGPRWPWPRRAACR